MSTKTYKNHQNILVWSLEFGVWSLEFGVWSLVLVLVLVLPGRPIGDKVDGLVLPGCVCQAAIRTKTF
jgi:hypothetical protein